MRGCHHATATDPVPSPSLTVTCKGIPAKSAAIGLPPRSLSTSFAAFRAPISAGFRLRLPLPCLHARSPSTAAPPAAPCECTRPLKLASQRAGLGGAFPNGGHLLFLRQLFLPLALHQALHFVDLHIVAAARVSSCLYTAPRVEFAGTQVGGKDMWLWPSQLSSTLFRAPSVITFSVSASSPRARASRSAFTMASAVLHAVLSGWQATASAGSKPAGLAILSATGERSSARSVKAANVGYLSQSAILPVLLELWNPEPPRACAAKLHATLLSRLPPWDPAARSSRSCHERKTRGKTAAQFFIKASFYSWHAPAVGGRPVIGCALHKPLPPLARFALPGGCLLQIPVDISFTLSRMTCSVLPNHNTSCFCNELTVLMLLTQCFQNLRTTLWKMMKRNLPSRDLQRNPTLATVGLPEVSSTLDTLRGARSTRQHARRTTVCSTSSKCAAAALRTKLQGVCQPRLAL